MLSSLCANSKHSESLMEAWKRTILASCCLACTPDSKHNAFWPDEMGDAEWCCIDAVGQEGHCLRETVVVVVDEEHSLLRLGVRKFCCSL